MSYRNRKPALFTTAIFVLIIFLPIAYFVTKNPRQSEAAWWNDTWRYRQAVNVTAHTTAQSNVYISATIDTSATGQFQVDCGDLRFLDRNSKNLPYFIVSGCTTASTVVHIQFQSFPAGAQTIYYYYGNSNAPNGFSAADFTTEASNYTIGSISTQEVGGNPIAYWKFDEGSGTTTNSSGQNNLNGTITNAIWKDESSCVSGKCLYFDGSGDYVTIQDPSDGSLDFGTSQNFTVAVWAKVQNPTAYHSFLGKCGQDNTCPGYEFFMNGSTIHFRMTWTGGPQYGTSTTTTYDIRDNNWHHLAAVVDRTNSKVYLYGDGKILNGSGGSISGVGNVDNSNSFTIGTSGAGSWPGLIDEVKVYPYARTSVQIKSDFASGKAGQSTTKGTSANLGSSSTSNTLSNGLLAYWKADEASGNGTDSSGNNNTTTVSGSSNYAVGKFGNGLRGGLATTNLFINPSLETNTTGWNFQVGAGAGSFAADATSSVFGSKNAKFVVSTVASNYPRLYYNAGALSDGVVYTISWYGKADSAGSTLRTTLENSGSGTNCASAGTTFLTPSYTTSWTRYSYSFTFSATNCPTTSPILMFQNPATQNYYLDGFQIEAASAATPYVDGTLGTGYAWTGTAHASTSTRALSYATATDIDLTTQFTLSAWVKGDDFNDSYISPYPSVITKTSSFFLVCDWGGMRVDTLGLSSTSLRVANTCLATDKSWHHWVSTYDGSKVILYKDGVEIGRNNATGTLTQNNNLVMLATSSGGSVSKLFTGTLDEVRMYNRALTPDEVTHLYQYAPGPAAYYNFEEGTGSNAQDKSGNGNTGTITAATWKSGKYGDGLLFNGSSSWVETTLIPAIPASRNYTQSLWFYPTSATNGILIDDYNRWEHYIRMNSDRTVKACYYDGSEVCATSTNTITLNTWNHIAAVIDSGNSIKVYVNGVLWTENTSLGGIQSKILNDVVIGAGGGTHPTPFTGIIDEVKIYNYARTPGQIVEDMNAGHPLGGSPVGSQLVWYKFDEGTGTTANNSGNSGTASKGTFGNTTAAPSWVSSGKFGKALNFTAANNTVVRAPITSTNGLDIKGAISYSVWFKRNSNTGYQTLIDMIDSCSAPGDGYYLRFNASQLVFYGIIDNAVGPDPFTLTYTNATSTGDTTNWHHMVATWDGTTKTNGVKMYMDGALVAQTTAAADSSLMASLVGSNLSVGTLMCNTHSFDGYIDEVKIYNSALTADEIKTDYNQGAATVFGSSNQTIGGTTTSINYCIPGDTTACAAPVAEYNFEEGSGVTVSDSSGNNNPGTLSGATLPAWVAGKIGKAINFDGTDDVLTIGDPASGILDFGTNSFSYGLWIKVPSSTGAFDMPWYKGGSSIPNPGYDMELGTGSWQANISDGTALKAVSFGSETLNQWVYLMAVVDKTNNKLYAYNNGRLVGTGTDITGMGSVSNSVSAVISSASYKVRGLIDQVRIYNYARTPAQVAWDYNQGKPIGWWKMDECQGTIINDSSGNGNVGTLTVGTSGTQSSTGTCQTTSTAWGNGLTGKFNYSLNFDGTDDYVGIADPVTNFPVSISMWIKPNIITANNIPIYLHLASGKWVVGGFYPSYGFITNTANVHADISNFAAGEWRHVVLVMTSPTAGTIYVNGVNKTTTSGQYWSENGTISTISGRNHANNFAGQIDDVRIYNYALTAEQIKQVYTNGAINFGPATGTP